MADNALIVTTIDVNVEPGKAKLRDFERAADQTAKKTDASAKSIAGMGSASQAAGTQGLAATVGLSSGLLRVAGIAGVALYGIKQLASGINALADAGDRVTSLRRGFETLSSRIGENADAFLNQLRPATRGMVSDMDLMQSANQAILLGLPITSDRFARLAEGAVKLGRTMGIDAKRSIDSVTEGIGRQSRLLLDNIGIVVDADAAYTRYAVSIGKGTSELTDAERKLAFFQAAEDAVISKTNGLGNETETLSEHLKAARNEVGAISDSMLDWANVMGGRLLTGSYTLSRLSFVLSTLKDSTPNLANLEDKLRGLSQAAKDPGGLAIFEKIMEAEEPLNRTTERVAALRNETRHLKEMLAEPRDPEQLTLIRIRLKQISEELDRVFDKAKEFKGFTGSVESKLPFPSNPSAPFGGGEPFGGRVPGSQLDPGIQGDPFGDAAREKRTELEQAAEDALLQIRIDAATEWGLTQQNLEQLQFEDRYARLIEQYQREGADTTAIFEAFQIEQTEIERRYADARAKIHQAELATRLGAVSMWLNVSSSVIGAVFEKNKKMQIAGGLINTAAAVVAALAFPPGPPATIPTAVAAGIMGLAQVAKMRSASMGGGGGGGGISGGAAAAAGPDYSSAIRTPTGQIAGNATGTTPVISGASTVATAQAGSAPAINVTIHATDAKSITEMMADPSRRRAFADGVNQQNARR